MQIKKNSTLLSSKMTKEWVCKISRGSVNRFYVTLNTDFENEKFKYADLGFPNNFWVKPLTHLSKCIAALDSIDWFSGL